MRNSADAELFSLGWWPGDRRRTRAAFFALAYPAPSDYAEAELEPAAARWDTELGEFVLDWVDIRTEQDPHALALTFAHTAFQHSCAVCDWSPELAETTPPLR